MISSRDKFTSELIGLKGRSATVWFSFMLNGIFSKGWATIEQASDRTLKLFTGGPIFLVTWHGFEPVKFEQFGPDDAMTKALPEILCTKGKYWKISSANGYLLIGEGNPGRAVSDPIYQALPS